MKKFLLGLALIVAALIGSPASAQDLQTSSHKPIAYDEEHGLIFKRYKPSYIVIGKADVKGQISFKLPVIEDTGLYLGYTQLLLWDIFQPSGPVRDVNYNPEVFYRFDLGGQHVRTLDVGAFEHESNGLAGTQSRSWNRSYLRFHQEYQKRDSAFQIVWEAKAWYQYWDDDGNHDIERYRGSYELNFTLAGMGHTVLNINDLTFRVFSGGPSTVDPSHGGQELDWRIMGPRQLLVPIFIQLYHGYGENLLDYKRKQWMLRAGIGF